MQRRHPLRHLLWRGAVAGVSNALMVSGLYSLATHGYRAIKGRDASFVKPMLAEHALSVALAAARPTGFAALPGAQGHGPRPIIVLHGYAMNRTSFWPLAYRLARAGLGPIYGFEYWTLGRTAAAARQLGWFIDEVREATGAETVDVVGHSMGGVVGRYYATLLGGDAQIEHLITIGSPHAGTELSKLGIGHATRELVLGSALVTRLAAAPPLTHAKLTVIASRADALVPAAAQPVIPGADAVTFDDLGHVAMLASRRVATTVIEILRT